ncbi:MAG: hypothetical protein HYS32_00390 [Candidatus Woesearchaeota archaeon]|nr:MAG: hypothetical protein HYS32_00390 [Candidatus Woesearchaeota archaeon]
MGRILVIGATLSAIVLGGIGVGYLSRQETQQTRKEAVNDSKPSSDEATVIRRVKALTEEDLRKISHEFTYARHSNGNAMWITCPLSAHDFYKVEIYKIGDKVAELGSFNPKAKLRTAVVRFGARDNCEVSKGGDVYLIRMVLQEANPKNWELCSSKLMRSDKLLPFERKILEDLLNEKRNDFR